MILISYGTRPEWLKVKPIIAELRKHDLPFKTVFTGQHEHLVQDTDPDHVLFIASWLDVDRLNNVLASTIIKISALLEQNKTIKGVLVQGDTTSALAVAIAAFNRGIKIIHVEAGLRTRDLSSPFPEEANRQLISRIAFLHYCPTMFNALNLRNECLSDWPQPIVVGNTALDNLVEYMDQCEYTDKVLITLHRRENHDMVDKWFKKFNKIAKKHPKIEFILPIHPNPNVQKYKHLLKNIKVVEPLSHHDLLNILVKCKLVISDSGGLQEEASFFKKKILVCRYETERREALNLTSFLTIPATIEMDFAYHFENFEPIEHECPFGDGYAAEKIVESLKREIYDIA
jgi:UDP-N-acetylglucosamine 2-epimerase (non-hydrolysing)